MDQRLYAYIKLYAKHLRPCFVASGVEYLFIKDDGHAFRKGTIGRRVGQVFGRAGIRRDVTVTATKIRKLFSSSAAEMSPTKKRAINAHIKHKESTADSNYVLKVNTDKASAAHVLMRNILDKGDSGVEQKAENPKPSTSSVASESEDEVPLVQVLGLPGRLKNYGLDDPNTQQKLDIGDKVVLRSVFKNAIEAGKLLTKHEVRSIMRTDEYVRKYVIKPAKVKQIADFVRYETNHVRQLKHMELEANEEGSGVVTMTSGSRRP